MGSCIISEWEWYNLPEHINARGLQEYLHEVWENRNIYKENQELTEEDLNDIGRFRQGFLRFDGNAIGAKNYVGFIQYEGFQINIYPKIFIEEYKKKHDFSSITSNLLYWLTFSSRIQFPFSEVSFEQQKFEHILEPFIFIFSQFTNRLLESIPYQRFEEITEQTTFVKGRVDINKYIVNSVSKGNYHKLYSTYESFQYNNKFNQIVKCVTKLLLQYSSNDSSIHALENILFLLDEVDETICTVDDCNKIYFNRVYNEWEKVLSMCRMFLANHSFKNQNSGKPNLCFLVPMELIYEEFIAGSLYKYGPTNIIIQGGGMSLTINNDFKLIPDIILNNNLLIDTKYKLLNKSNKTFDITQVDLYQMVAYAIRFKIPRIVLLYPRLVSDNSILNNCISSYDIKDEFSNTDINIKIIESNIAIHNEKFDIDFTTQNNVLELLTFM